jgi:hypothetical protein
VLEFASVIAREVRMKNLAEADARAALGEFDRLVMESLNVLVPTVADFGQAGDYI